MFRAVLTMLQSCDGVDVLLSNYNSLNNKFHIYCGKMIKNYYICALYEYK